MYKHHRHSMPRRGAVLLTALVFVILIGAMASVISSYSMGNMVLGAADADSTRALVAAESGMSYLLLQIRMTPMPIILQGSIGDLDTSQLSVLWTGTNIEGLGSSNNGIAVQLANAINQCGSFVNSPSAVAVPGGLNPMVTPAIAVDPTISKGPNFILTVEWDSGNPQQATATSASKILLHLTSVGTSGKVSREVTMDVSLQKTLRYAVYSNIAIQLGKNTVVTGDIVSKMTDFTKGPPVWSLSDFRLTGQTALNDKLDQFRDFLTTHDPSYSNRMNVWDNPELKALAEGQGFYDASGDGYLDDYDVFLSHLDPGKTGRITQSQFTASDGKPMDAQLFVLLDTINPPYQPGAQARSGLTYNSTPDQNSLLNQWLGLVDNCAQYDGDGQLDNNDGYAKINGNVKVGVSAEAWETWANSGGAMYGAGYREQLQGPIISPDPTEPPIQFNYKSADAQDLTPQSFDTTSYGQRAGTGGVISGRIAQGATVTDKIVAYANATETSTVTEGSPKGTDTPQSTYKRPVFKNVKFVNCKIAKGTNALFQNCTFEGVTYVDLQTNVTDSGGATTSDPSKGMTWSKKMNSGYTFKSTTALTATTSKGFQEGNNLRFDACIVNGPMASAVPSAYTHFTNNWEFNGTTVFNNTSDPTATILAPNTNVDCGSFDAPPTGPLPTSSLTGVVVAGNVNMRGGAWNVDGSIIITGNGGKNTTLGYFGDTDAAVDPHAIPTGGFGRIALRYNPTRAMPGGILVPLTVIRMPDTYQIH